MRIAMIVFCLASVSVLACALCMRRMTVWSVPEWVMGIFILSFLAACGATGAMAALFLSRGGV